MPSLPSTPSAAIPTSKVVKFDAPNSGGAPPSSVSANSMYVRPLSTKIHSHPPTPTSTLTLAESRALQQATETSVTLLPHSYQCWVLTALRKLHDEQKYGFDTWRRSVGLPLSPPLSLVSDILLKPLRRGKKQQQLSLTHGFMHTEEDLTTLSNFVRHSAPTSGPHSGPASLLSKLLALTSRHSYIAALNHLRLQTFLPNAVILAQGTPTPTPLALGSFTVLAGGVKVIQVPAVMSTTETVTNIVDDMTSMHQGVHTNPHPIITKEALLELETAGDVAPLPLYSSFGETPLEVPDGDLVEYPSPFWYIATGNTATATTSVLTIDRHHYKHASRTHGAAALLRERITFLKNSRLFTSLPHADVVALAGMLVKETFKEKEVLCVAGETAHCFFFILTGEVLCQYFPPDTDAHTPDDGVHVKPSHDTNVILKHSSVLQEDVIIGVNPTHDVTAVCHSATCDVFKVPATAWGKFRASTIATRMISLLYKDEAVTDAPLNTLQKIPTLHNRFTTIRSMLSQTRPHRAIIPIFTYNHAYATRQMNAKPTTTTATPSTVHPPPSTKHSIRGLQTPKSFNNLLTPMALLSPMGSTPTGRASSGRFSQYDDTSVTSRTSHPTLAGGPGATGAVPHLTLDAVSVKNLGVAARMAREVTVEQRRTESRGYAKQTTARVRKELERDFIVKNVVKETLDLQAVNGDRLEEKAFFDHAMKEVRAAIVVVASGAVTNDGEEEVASDGLKNIIGEIFFGGDRKNAKFEAPSTPQALAKLRALVGTDRNLNITLQKMKSFGGTEFKRKMGKKGGAEGKAWSSEEELTKAFKKKREERITALQDLMLSCDEAMDYGFGDGAVTTTNARGGLFFDYTQVEQRMMEHFDELMSGARNTAAAMEKMLVEETNKMKDLVLARAKSQPQTTVAPQTPYWKDVERYAKAEEARQLAAKELAVTEKREALEKQLALEEALEEAKRKPKRNISKLPLVDKASSKHLLVKVPSRHSLVKQPSVLSAPVSPSAPEFDPKSVIKKKARAGWGNIKKVATTHLEKDEKSEKGVQNMMMSTVRAVDEEGGYNETDPVKRLLLEEEKKIKEREEEEANMVTWKRCNPNSMYFKTAAVSDTAKSAFLNFDSVLDIDCKSLRGLDVNPAAVLKESVSRLREAKTLPGGEGTTLRAGVMKKVGGVMKVGGGGKKLTDLEEWQIFHVEKCLVEREQSKSLPNLMGKRGKFKLSTRAPPAMLHM